MLSYTRGPDYPLVEITIGEQLRKTAERVGDSLDVVSCHQSRRLTWAQLDDVTDRLARGFWSLGIRKTYHVGLWSTNCVEWVILQMACARAGAILVNINPAHRSHELRFTLNKSRIKAIFLWPSDVRADYEAILQEAAQGQSLQLRASDWHKSGPRKIRGFLPDVPLEPSLLQGLFVVSVVVMDSTELRPELPIA